MSTYVSITTLLQHSLDHEISKILKKHKSRDVRLFFLHMEATDML